MEWLYIARIVSTFAVIVLHISAYTVSLAELGSFSWWAGNVYDSLARWCVPVFVMISGALLLAPEKNENLSFFYKKRMSKVFYPLVFWSVFFILWGIGKAKLSGGGENDVLKNIINGRPYYHMWFLYMIIGLYIFTPLIRILVKNASEENLLFFIFLMFAFCSLSDAYNFSIGSNDFLFISEFIYYLPYYISGYLIARKKSTRPSSHFLFLFFISFSFTCISFYLLSIALGKENGLYFYNYLSINVIVMSISFMWIFKNCHINHLYIEKLKSLADFSLGTYLIHPVFVELLYYLASKKWIEQSIFAIPLISAIVFSCCIISVFLIKKVPYLRRVV
ncbi:acyltransferase [Dickeya chrysanthemi]|uniref:acyltransferase n=1 Tax=Dickeya chrysanthemi TaxID=556 RepID=UPI001C8E3365|nr:acyltransferase family protein [Dickeya chrysanthemi]MBX9448114.1 acyltransferase family protein [Dickeya chrysanthemi]